MIHACNLFQNTDQPYSISASIIKTGFEYRRNAKPHPKWASAGVFKAFIISASCF